MYQPPNAPLSVGGVLDSGFKLFRECFTQVFLLAVVTSLVTAPIALVAPYVQANPGALGPLGSMGVGIVAIAIVWMIVTSAIVVRIDGVARGAPVPLVASLGIGARRAPAALLAAILSTLALLAVPCVVLIGMAVVGLTTPVALIAAGVLLLFLPGSVIAVWLLFGPYAAIVDRLGPVASLRESLALTRGHWWRTAGLATIIAIILMVVYVAMALVASAALIVNPEAALSGQSPWWLQLVVGPILSGVAVPLSYTLFMAIFYDLKLRREGGDLAARIAATA